MSQPSATPSRKVCSHTSQSSPSSDLLLHMVTGREALSPWLRRVSTAGLLSNALKKGINVSVCQDKQKEQIL